MEPDPPFLPGLELSRRFYEEAVRPVLATHFPDLRYSAGRLEGGSDVLGYDTPRSTDHGWGPRLLLFLSEEDSALREEILHTLSHHLPLEIGSFPTHFSSPDLGQAAMQKIESGPVTHGVTIQTVRGFFQGYLGVDPFQEISIPRWLTLFEHRLRTVASGQVFHDDLDELNTARANLRYYPHDLWLYLLACQWGRIGQEEAFMGRSAEAGDELGSRVIAARLVREVMRLGFLMEKTYAPYTKWFGTAFARLRCGPTLVPILEQAVSAPSWQEREAHLSAAYSGMAELHNGLGVTEPLSTEVSPYFNRPYQVISAGRFVEALFEAIQEPEVRRLPLIGSATQFVDSTDVLDPVERIAKLQIMYG